MKYEVIEPPVAIGKAPVIATLSCDPEALVLAYDTDADGVELAISFQQPRAFRWLDEGDLTRYWEIPDMVENWFFEILSGGWLEHESKGHMEVSASMGLREFLICDPDNCVTVIANAPPAIDVKEST
jgi:hypothetical protein